MTVGETPTGSPVQRPRVVIQSIQVKSDLNENLVFARSVVSLSMGDLARLQLETADEKSILAMARAEEHQQIGAQGKILDFLLQLSHPEDVEDQQVAAYSSPNPDIGGTLFFKV